LGSEVFQYRLYVCCQIHRYLLFDCRRIDGLQTFCQLARSTQKV
jgi:hypothetical protein